MILEKIVNKDDANKLFYIEKKIFKNEAYSLKQIEEIIFMENYTSYFIKEKDIISGYIIIFDNSEAFEIMKIGVLEENRKTGIGKKLINKIKEKEKNIFLEVRETNISAVSFYLANDFKKVGIRKNYYNNKENAILMLFSKK
ncbi:GNAT family N-acetyltransferase [Fusobacterium sp. IOR10]|uniref:GNAT family N-acetyltransferase n=1 Tax=Fusobacterium sp. IOR10 TaxID=2665157 RepID=UPI0013D65C5A|nr:GNAT family N-acetyltransferase [Fusobacterium sp. IOR10]